MQKTIVICDICAKEDAHRLTLSTGREMDGAGDTETIWKDVDLCASCVLAQMDILISCLSMGQRELMAVSILKHKEVYNPGRIGGSR